MIVWPTLFLSEKYLETRMSQLGKRLLLCGVKTTREKPYYEQVFFQHGGSIVIVEPFAQNLAYCREHYPHAELRLGFAQDVNESFDTIIWLQGPEHVEKDVAISTMNRFRELADMVVAECPHGVHPQGAEGENNWETHLSYLYPEDFDDQWFKAIGPHDSPRENWGDNQHMLIANQK